METINKILESLNVDETIFYQMGIFIVLFIILKFVFFERLQGVIELREDKTTKRKEAADKKFAEAEELSLRYQEKMKKANIEGREIYNRHKKQIVDEEKVRLKKAEDEINVEFEKEVENLRDEMSHREKELLKDADGLCSKLMEKLTV